MGQLERQTIEMHNGDNCEKILKEANVKVGDELEIIPRPIVETKGFVTAVNWEEEIPIKYLSCSDTSNSIIDEIGMEFNYDGNPVFTYLNKFYSRKAEDNWAFQKLKDAEIIR